MSSFRGTFGVHSAFLISNGLISRPHVSIGPSRRRSRNYDASGDLSVPTEETRWIIRVTSGSTVVDNGSLFSGTLLFAAPAIKTKHVAGRNDSAQPQIYFRSVHYRSIKKDKGPRLSSKFSPTVPVSAVSANSLVSLHRFAYLNTLFSVWDAKFP